ncbi:peptidoglycan editing factor PgeF [Dokdonella sp. MW10]|uniref:peptidoglycan editing factor PgeF n=1 Tax=Dokdonella sp. MW10 TaxID=2992926 RepID=UPI003F80E729
MTDPVAVAATRGEGFVRPDLLLAPGVHVAVTTRALAGASHGAYAGFNLGDRCGDQPAAVAANRSALVDLLGLPAPPRWLRQVHGVEVATSGADEGEPPEADAAFADTPGSVLAVLTADCLPIVFASREGRVIAAAHAGWRGLAAGVLEATLMHFACAREDVVAWIGPAIGAASYEVGIEVHEAFVGAHPSDADAFTATRAGHWLCDLEALARARLSRAGLVDVRGGGFDTLRDVRFYSHRGAAPTGRFATLIWRDAPRA